MNVKFITFLIFIVTLFFIVVGVNVVITSKNQVTDFTQEDPSNKFKEQLKKAQERKLEVRRKTPLGTSSAERRYRAALDAVEEEKRYSHERREKKRKIRNFVTTTAGGYLAQGMEHLQAGEMNEARAYITRALELHDDFDFEIYVLYVKTLLHSYIEDSDKQDLDKAVMKYLKLIEGQYSDDSFQKVVGEIIEIMENKILGGDDE